ncbi:MAG: protein kinase, partial [Chloroflexi bacterium]|nr:protein kinase [Chloroflexota bacterium]
MQPLRTCSKCDRPLAPDTSEALCPVCALRSVADGGVEPEPEAQPAEPGGRKSVASDQSSAVGRQGSVSGEPRTGDLGPLPTGHCSLVTRSAFGDYELLEEIARGGMGVVFKARQKSLNRIVALKMIVGGLLASPSALQRFRAEAQAAASLQHPIIVAIHEVGVHEGQPFFSMDYVEGRNLAEVLRDGPLEPRRAAGYAKTIAEAVAYAHQRGVLHRDLKPSNVVIDRFDQPRITDFGLAKRFVAQASLPALSPTSSRPAVETPPASGAAEAPAGSKPATLQTGSLRYAEDLTLSGQVLGSPNFMAPEQAQGRHREVGPPSDVYSIGALLYHLLTGRPPFQAATLTEVLRQVVATEPAAPRLLNPSLPRDLETICLKCLEKDIPRRYPTAQALADELGRFLREEPIFARPIGRVGKAAKWCRRNPRLTAAMGFALLSLLIGLSGVSWQWRRAEAQRARAEAEALLARRNAHAADMKEVQRALEDNDLGRAWQLLNHQRPQRQSQISNFKSQIQTDLRGWEGRYFWSRCQSEERFTLCRYSNAASALAFSPDGRWLAVRRADAKVALWDTVAKRSVAELPGAGLYKALAFSPRGNLLA